MLILFFSPKISGASSENADSGAMPNSIADVALLERIDDFDATIKINSDASLDVSEKISYDFGTNVSKHGIYREITVKYKARGGNYNLSSITGMKSIAIF